MVDSPKTDPQALRLELRTLVIQSQHEIVSYKGISTITRNRLIGAWGEIWTRFPECELDVSFIFSDKPFPEETNNADSK